MHRYLSGFEGFFENIFKLNDLTFFDELQLRLEAEGVYFKGLSIKDVYLYNLLRINLEFKDYSGTEKISRLLIMSPIFSVTNNPDLIPMAADINFVRNKLPVEEVFRFFRLLVQECIDLGIIVPES